MTCQRVARIVEGLHDATGQHRRVVGLGGDDARLRRALTQHAGHALERAAGAETADEVVQGTFREVGQDLLRRGRGMSVGIGFVGELPAEEPAVFLGQFDRLVQHAGSLLRRRREHHFRAEETHQAATFDAEVFRHRDDQRIALLRADHGQADAGIAAGGLDDCLPRFQRAVALGRLNDAECQAVLHRTERIERLDLDVQVDTRGRELVDANNRRVADRGQDVLMNGHGLLRNKSLCA
jgi:hypothetical protein